MTDAFPVLLGICLDAEAIWLGRAPENAQRPVLLSHGAFAVREGLGLLLDLLDRHGVTATFYLPGITADRYPDAVRRIHDRGHELASHGHGHRPIHTLSAEEERSELLRGIESVERITGERPPAWRSPSWEWSARTLDLLLESGVTVSANFHDALRPYRHLRDGAALPLVELPVQWHLADAPYFLYGGMPGRMIRPAADVQRLWEEEFEGLYGLEGAFYHLTLHVQLIGHPGRLAMLDRHLAFVAGHPRARFMTASGLAATV